MPVELPAAWIVALNAGGWLVIQLGLAWAFTRMPARWFRYRPGPHAGRPDAARLYEEFLSIRRWKDRLPDGAGWFAGGFAKAGLASRESAYLQSFAGETRRGEWCHWTVIACTPVFLLWNPWWAWLINLAYALAANLPCILVQRYNRIRLARSVVRRGRGTAVTRSRPST